MIEYSLKGINTPLGVAGYELTRKLPRQLKGEIPTIKELADEIEKEAVEFKEQLNPLEQGMKAVKRKVNSSNRR